MSLIRSHVWGANIRDTQRHFMLTGSARLSIVHDSAHYFFSLRDRKIISPENTVLCLTIWSVNVLCSHISRNNQHACMFYSWFCCSLCDISSACLFALLSCSRTRLSSCIWSCLAFFFSSCRSESCASFMASRAVSLSRALRSNSACLEWAATAQQHSTSHFTAAKQPWPEVPKIFIVHISL